DIAVHASVDGLYRAPVLSGPLQKVVTPPQMIISVPVHTALKSIRVLGAPTVDALPNHVSVAGS
ncbi:MAG TPA: hypothetical protein VK661_02730, partial [Planctomycetota bacterium]|nr:hypothetical protein [Planctomycetota bacterium]